MAKVLFINPVVREEDAPKHVPYGIGLLASISDKLGHQVQIYDANAWRAGDDTLKAVIESDDWDVVAMGGITTTYAYVKKIISYSIRYAPRALRVLGGGILTSMPHDIMRLIPGVDLGVVGEAFNTWPEILEKVDRENFDFSTVNGVIHRHSSVQTHLSPARPLIRDLDVLPYPAWDMLPLDIYFRNSSLLLSEESYSSRVRMDINGSFGCPFICRFCFHLGLAGDLQYENTADPTADTVFTYDRDNRWHSPAYIVKMVKYLRDTYGMDFVIFFDENLLAMNAASRGKWMPEICRLWIAEGLQPQCVRDKVPHHPDHCTGVHWGGTSHATLAEPNILRQMHEAGCSQLVYGYESFNRRVLKNIGKGATPETNERSLKITMEAGIRPLPNQIMGFPDDWYDSFLDCVHAWDRLGIVVSPFFATPYPGSEWYNKYKDRILAQYNGDLDAFLMELGDATRLVANISQHFTNEELLEIRELMVKRDVPAIHAHEQRWREKHNLPHGLPEFEDVRWTGALKRKTG